MDIDEFKNEMESAGLNKHLRKLQTLLKSTIRLIVFPDLYEMPIGQTKIGGTPDLPMDIAWPTEATTDAPKSTSTKSSSNKAVAAKPLSFIAQLNLAELSPFDNENVLPKSGLLYFFYTSQPGFWGTDYREKDKFKVIYWNGNISQLNRTEFPADLPDGACFESCNVETHLEISVPPRGHDIYNDFTESEEEKFWEEVYNGWNYNKLLGYPNEIQGPMEFQCELVTNGLPFGGPSGSPQANSMSPQDAEKDWLLLLQIDSNGENDMMWADYGRLYFWIGKDDLRNKRFEKSWVVLQCY